MFGTEKSAYLIQDGLGRTVETHIDDLLLVVEGLPDKIPDKYLIGSPGINLPDDVVTYVQGFDEIIETVYAG